MANTEEEMGMTDLQYKSMLKQLVRRLEDIESTEDEGEKSRKLAEVIQDLKGDIEG